MNIQKMMKQVQKLQADMARMHEELARRTVEATAGGGVVTAVVNGRLELVDLRLDPEVVDPEDVEMLQELVRAAVNEGLRKAQAMANEELAKITGGLNIPGLPGMM